MSVPTQLQWSLPHLNGVQADRVLAALFALVVLCGVLSWVWLGSALLTVLCSIGLLLLTYTSFLEPRWLSVTHTAVSFPLSHPLRIAVIADFHTGPFKGAHWVDHVVQKTYSLKPDLILLPGDFLFDPTYPLAPLEPLKYLSAPLGVFAVAGNHDAGNLTDRGRVLPFPDRTAELEQYLGTLGIRLLRNASTVLSHHGEQFAIAGIDDLWSESCNLNRAVSGIPTNMPTILLAHEPDIILEAQSAKANLIVSGHTHGGQVCFPGGYPAAGVPSLVGKRYAHGLFQVHDHTSLFVTRGCGETMLRVRFCCRPEVAILESNHSSDA